MYRLLRLLFIGTWELPKKPEPCSHTYEIYETGDTDYNRYITSRCTKCGDIHTHAVV